MKRRSVDGAVLVAYYRRGVIVGTLVGLQMARRFAKSTIADWGCALEKNVAASREKPKARRSKDALTTRKRS